MSKRRRPGASRKVAEAKYWGTAGEATAPKAVRPTPVPSALVRSLGAPPLSVDSGLAERHLAAVYEEAVRAATALVAANGLLAVDDD
ncbi:MAG: hypothetical protein ACRDXE_08595 [Acidimicrobiales bacterium]